jgi:hypothetical protein
LAVVFGAALVAQGAQAQGVPVETGRQGANMVTLHVHPFLNEQELTTLRLVLTNPDALSIFVPERRGHAALAMAPDEGFIRDGAPVRSAIAIGALPDAATAAADALKACDAARKGGKPCVVVLEVGPAR